MRIVAVGAVAALALWSAGVAAQVSTHDADWTTFLGSDSGTSYSALSQINRDNVGQLVPAWMFSLGVAIQNSTPVVVDGTMYITGADDRVYALDATTGRLRWTYGTGAPTSGYARGSASVVVGSGLVYYGNRDNHLVAIDAATGREVWDVQIEDHKQCACTPSHGLLLVKGKIIVGVRGDLAHRSYINAFDAKTGHLVWRWWVIPAAGEPGHDSWPDYLWKLGGGATWYGGSYDPKLNLIYWGTANPQPIMGGGEPFDKLWTNSLVALDADTGAMKWGFQEGPRDSFDYDSASEPMLVDAMVDGKLTPLVVHSVKSGYTYVMNRATGALIAAYPYAEYVNWNKGLDKAGRPIDALQMNNDQAVLVCPSYYGARAANHGTYSPHTGWWYSSSTEFCSRLRRVDPPKLVEGHGYNAAKDEGIQKSPQSQPFIAAFDPVSGERRWVVHTEVPNISSLMATGGDLLFGSDLFGEAWALDATTGQKLWSFNMGSQSGNSPISYAAHGRQYVAIVLGGGGAYPMHIRELWPEKAASMPPLGAFLIVFALPSEPK